MEQLLFLGAPAKKYIVPNVNVICIMIETAADETESILRQAAIEEMSEVIH
ncbi:MAG: hypothetical protein AAGU23_06010 [Bacillota bacterium]